MHAYCASLWFLIKYIFSAFLLETQWAWCVHILTRSLHKTIHFPLRTFPFILLWQERKEERGLLKHMATSKQHHYAFDKKNPHSNILSVFSRGKKMHSISITQLTMPISLSSCTTAQIYYYAVHSLWRVFGKKRKKRVIPGYCRLWDKLNFMQFCFSLNICIKKTWLTHVFGCQLWYLSRPVLGTACVTTQW